MSALVVGCGYVGRVLASDLAADGVDVTAVTRSGVSIPGVESVRADVTDPPLDLPAADAVYYLISAGARDPGAYRAAYVRGLEAVVDAVAPDALVYASSTGVYPTEDGSWVDEETPITPDTERRRVLLEAERVARDAGGTAVRFAGLYGPGRLGLDRYLGDARVPAGYLNLLHRADAARAMRVARAATDDLFVAVDDEPVERHAFARWLADRTGRTAGTLAAETRTPNKRCANDRLRAAGWAPRYPTFREGYAAALGDE